MMMGFRRLARLSTSLTSGKPRRAPPHEAQQPNPQRRSGAKHSNPTAVFLQPLCQIPLQMGLAEERRKREIDEVREQKDYNASEKLTPYRKGANTIEEEDPNSAAGFCGGSLTGRGRRGVSGRAKLLGRREFAERLIGDLQLHQVMTRLQLSISQMGKYGSSFFFTFAFGPTAIYNITQVRGPIHTAYRTNDNKGGQNDIKPPISTQHTTKSHSNSKSPTEAYNCLSLRHSSLILLAMQLWCHIRRQSVMYFSSPESNGTIKHNQQR